MRAAIRSSRNASICRHARRKRRLAGVGTAGDSRKTWSPRTPTQCSASVIASLSSLAPSAMLIENIVRQITSIVKRISSNCMSTTRPSADAASRATVSATDASIADS